MALPGDVAQLVAERAHSVHTRNFSVASSVEVDNAEPEHDQIENEEADAQQSRSIAFA